MMPDDLTAEIQTFVEASPLNVVAPDCALRPDLIGMRIFEPPLVGVAAADDPWFDALRLPGVIGPHFRPPRDWLPGAASVIAFFLPFTDAVVRTNRRDPDWPSDEWLHARIEGQTFIGALCSRLVDVLTASGYAAIAPGIYKDFRLWRENGPEGTEYTSTWSERHVGHVAGLGTFGLSAGIITARGMAGRMGSVVTDCPLPPTARPYSAFDEYCTHCGACVKRCPKNAISATRGRDKATCSDFLDQVGQRRPPWYGCGKCQVAIPCERGIPRRPQT